MSETILNCYDSHVHFLATGQIQAEFSLKDLKSANDIKNISILKSHYRKDWLIGFGWNHHQWESQQLPDKNILDELFPDTPVFFSRVDGHSSWINSKAIQCLREKKYNFDLDPAGGKIVRDINGEPTGILIDQAHIAALMLLPEFSDEQIKTFLCNSGQTFNQGGFTHVRDLSMSYRQWKLQKELCAEKKLRIYCEGFITVESVQGLEKAFAEYQLCLQDPSPYLKIKGLKIFIDGSLGSETACLSRNYVGKNHSGLLIWSKLDIKTAIEFCWKNKIEIAIHTIGDEAVHTASVCAREVSAAGFLGKLHLEHAELIRPETIQLLKPLHVYIHMQPCHWLSDHSWVSDKIGDLTKYLFHWESLRKNKIHFDFGSDSPIEPPQLLYNKKALDLSAKNGIPELKDDWKKLHTYPSNWGQAITQFDGDQILSVEFDGEKII